MVKPATPTLMLIKDPWGGAQKNFSEITVTVWIFKDALSI